MGDGIVKLTEIRTLDEFVDAILSQVPTKSDCFLMGHLFKANPSTENLAKFLSALFPILQEGTYIWRVGEGHIIKMSVDVEATVFSLLEAIERGDSLEQIRETLQFPDAAPKVFDGTVDDLMIQSYTSAERSDVLTRYVRFVTDSPAMVSLAKIIDSTPLQVPPVLNISPVHQPIIKPLAKEYGRVWLLTQKIIENSTPVQPYHMYFYSNLLLKTLLYMLHRASDGIVFVAFYIASPFIPIYLGSQTKGNKTESRIVVEAPGKIVDNDKNLTVRIPITDDFADHVLLVIRDFLTGTEIPSSAYVFLKESFI